MKTKYAIINQLSAEVMTVTYSRGKVQPCIFSSRTQAEEVLEGLEEDGYAVSLAVFKVMA